MRVKFKKFILLSLIIFCCQNIFAQRKKKNTTIIGFFYGTEFLATYEQDHRFSNQIGLYTDFKNNSRFSFSISLFYAQRNFATSPVKDKIREDAITGELFLKCNLKLKWFKFYFGIGYFQRYSLKIIGEKYVPDSPLSPLLFSIDEPKINETKLGGLPGYTLGGGFNWRFTKNIIFSPHFGWNSYASRNLDDKNLSTKTAVNNISLKLRCGYRISK
jgi:hypothetical protein